MFDFYLYVCVSCLDLQSKLGFYKYINTQSNEYILREGYLCAGNRSGRMYFLPTLTVYINSENKKKYLWLIG